jgi:nitrous oxidase accessory protein NosD
MAARSKTRRCLAAAAALGAGAWLVGATAAPASATDSHHHRHHHAVFVSAHAKSGNSGRSCHSARYATIAAGVAAAHAGGTVVVCRGTYAEDVVIGKALNLVGRHATIDATGMENAIQVVASKVRISGFRLMNANGEGLLVGVDAMSDASMLPKGSPVLTHVSVGHVAVVNNDKGFNGTEKGNCKYPGDCGGGIHFNVVAWSRVTDSWVVGNADGILLTDDYGPNSHNLVADNYVADNKTECGIVLPSHSTNAVSFDPKTFVVTGRNPMNGGVYDNVVRDNIAVRNGTAKAPPQFGGGGAGAGIGVFGSGPGSAAYDNVIEDNYMAGNGLAGFTIHAHHPGGEDVNGNKVIDNRFGTNNLGGDGFDGPPVTNFKTTAIAVFSVPPVHMTITDNVISHNEIGMWLSTTVKAKGLHDNEFHHVSTKVVRG